MYSVKIASSLIVFKIVIIIIVIVHTLHFDHYRYLPFSKVHFGKSSIKPLHIVLGTFTNMVGLLSKVYTCQ